MASFLPVKPEAHKRAVGATCEDSINAFQDAAMMDELHRRDVDPIPIPIAIVKVNTASRKVIYRKRKDGEVETVIMLKLRKTFGELRADDAEVSE